MYDELHKRNVQRSRLMSVEKLGLNLYTRLLNVEAVDDLHQDVYDNNLTLVCLNRFMSKNEKNELANELENLGLNVNYCLTREQENN